jgi:hypothetical protein
MSDIMLLGILRMPLPDNPSDMGVMEWLQVRDRMRQAADEIEKLTAERDALQKELDCLP